MTYKGYSGKILRVDLSKKSVEARGFTEAFCEDYIGGVGFAAKIIADGVQNWQKPLDEQNPLVFMTGPITGTMIPWSGRHCLAGISPLTGLWGEAYSGGTFARELKRAGYDGIVITGKADKLVYLKVQDDTATIEDATKFAGVDTYEIEGLLRKECGDKAKVAAIGIAGENLVRFACVINDGPAGRAAARCGLGAVMGSKNLKAIAIRGTGTVDIASEQKLKRALKVMRKEMKNSPVLYPFFSKYGTSRGVNNHSGKGIFPAKNWTATGEFAPLEKLGFEARLPQKVGQTSCAGCPVGCGQLNLAKTGDYAGILAEGPEYETVYAYGGQTGVDDLDSIIAADRLSDEFGLDTLSAGVTIGFAMELFERGILTPEDTGGMELTFGNHRAMVKLLQMMTYREGLGALLADGVKVAAKKIGRGSEQYALHVKGLELPAYDVRGAKSHGLNYATSFNGADHNRGYAIQEIFGVPVPFPADRFTIEDKGKLTKWNQDVRTATCDSPTMCAFILDMALAPIALQNTADLMEAVTGVSYTPEEVMKVGERINNVARAFNVREGFIRSDDTLPERILTEPLKEGASKGHYISKEELETMLDEYYSARGWAQETGVPTRKKLVELGLEYVADQLG